MAFPIATLLPASFAEWVRVVVVALMVAAVTWPLAYCDGKRAGKAQMQLAIEQANTRYLTQKARADALAADQRLTDQRTVTNLERELSDAVANIPDEVPTARRLARACAQLRSQGVDTAALPQCR